MDLKIKVTERISVLYNTSKLNEISWEELEEIMKLRTAVSHLWTPGKTPGETATAKISQAPRAKSCIVEPGKRKRGDLQAAGLQILQKLNAQGKKEVHISFFVSELEDVLRRHVTAEDAGRILCFYRKKGLLRKIKNGRYELGMPANPHASENSKLASILAEQEREAEREVLDG